MTNTELTNLRTALETKRRELSAQLRGRVKELTIEGAQPDMVDWIQAMSDRDHTAGMLSRCSSTLADVERSLQAIDEHAYGDCIKCDCPIPVKRLQSIPWAAYCVRCQELIEAEQNGWPKAA